MWWIPPPLEKGKVCNSLRALRSVFTNSNLWAKGLQRNLYQRWKQSFRLSIPLSQAFIPGKGVRATTWLIGHSAILLLFQRWRYVLLTDRTDLHNFFISVCEYLRNLREKKTTWMSPKISNKDLIIDWYLRKYNSWMYEKLTPLTPALLCESFCKERGKRAYLTC